MVGVTWVQAAKSFMLTGLIDARMFLLVWGPFRDVFALYGGSNWGYYLISIPLQRNQNPDKRRDST